METTTVYSFGVKLPNSKLKVAITILSDQELTEGQIEQVRKSANVVWDELNQLDKFCVGRIFSVDASHAD